MHIQNILEIIKVVILQFSSKTYTPEGVTRDNFIDGTLIINKSGIENIGYGCGESLKKKFTSLTAVCNDNTKPISIICSFLRKRIRPKGYNANYMKITKKNNIIKTLPHDSKSILPSINQINNDDLNKNIKYSS